MKDIVFVDTGSIHANKNWKQLSAKYPYAKRIKVDSTRLEDVIERAKANTFTSAFWIVYDDITFMPTMFDFSYSTTEWDDHYVHVWRYLHNFKPSLGGVYHVSRNHAVPLQIKPMKTLAGYINDKTPSAFDIFFISYFEPNADENWNKLVSVYPKAKRIDGVKGIHNAHIKAAEKSSTKMFWVIDADAVLLPEFKLGYRVLPWDMDNVYVWRSINPVNKLIYGYGGVKLLPKELTLKMSMNSVDMTTSISKKFVSVNTASNITSFNVDEFNTWKSAFRECVKLASQVIEESSDTAKRLDIWCSKGIDAPYGKYCIAGANAGKAYGEENRDDPDALKRINDFKWLHEQFSEYSVG